MALNKKIALVGFDKQASGKGTLATTAKYAMGLRGGTVFSMEMDQPYEELTIADRFPPSAYRVSFQPGAEVTSRAWPKSIGALLYYTLGSISTAGAGDPFTHTITPGTTPQYTTWFARLDSEYHKIRDAKVDELSFTWSEAEPIEIGVTVMGTVASMYQTSWTPTNDDSGEVSFFPGGGTFKAETNSATPVTADISGGTITIRNHLDPIRLSKSTEPDDTWPGLHEIEVALTLIPSDTSLWRKIITGTGAAQVKTDSPIYGSFEIKWTIQTGPPERSLKLEATKIAFTGEYPEADPAGGPVELEIVGTVVKPAGAAFTATLLNDQNATAYTAGS